MPLHLWRGIKWGYLLVCTPWGEYGPMVAIAIFGLSSLEIWWRLIASDTPREPLQRWQKRYRAVLRRVDQVCNIGLIGAITIGCLVEISEYLTRMGWEVKFVAYCLFGATIQVAEREEEFVEALSGYGFTIEESGRYYRITVGELHWVVNKEHQVNRLIWAVLLYAASHRVGARPGVTKEQLARALGWEHWCHFYYLFVHYQKEGSDFGVILPELVNQGQRIRDRAVQLWLEDLSLSLAEVREKLRQQGIHVSAEKLRGLLRLVDFVALRKAWNHSSEKRAETEVHIAKLGEEYRLRVGSLHWKVPVESRFSWTGLLYWLHQARDGEGKGLFPLRTLVPEGLHSHQHLDQLFGKYEILAQRYRAIHWVGTHQDENRLLSQKILDLWLDDITLSAEKIAARLIEQGLTQSISVSTVYNLVRQVDFMDIRQRMVQDYRQGKYRKSTEWVMQRYQELIGNLLLHLSRGEHWPKAQIERFVSDLPATLYPDGPQKLPCPPHSSLAWLKCYLFNLPRCLDGKICCPHCGSFETTQKSRIPQTHLVQDPQMGQQVLVHSFRFCCHNKLCDVGTFSATADGSHLLDEQRFAQACLMLRLVMSLHGSYRSVAQLMGLAKSTVFSQLTLVSQTVQHWPQILGTLSFSGTVCIDEKFVRIALLKKDKGKRNFAYLFLAVDPLTYDLLHLEVYPSRDGQAIVAFLTALKVQGIFPQVIMTDLFAGYDSAIHKVYGRSVTISKCHFHFKSNIHKHLYDQFGRKETDIPKFASQLREDIFFIVDAHSKKTIQERYRDLQTLKAKYLEREPKLRPLFDCLDSYLPNLLRVIEHEEVFIFTNNACELVIRHFNQRYKLMGCFESLDSARRHARLFQIFHRFTPLAEDAKPHLRGKCPLQLAGYHVEEMPIFQYLTAPLLVHFQPAQAMALCKDLSA